MYNKFSRVVTKDDSQPAAQAMLHAIGLSEEDFDKLLKRALSETKINEEKTKSNVPEWT